MPRGKARSVLVRNNILEYEGFRARIDLAKPQQVGCHLLGARVNNRDLQKSLRLRGFALTLHSR